MNIPPSTLSSRNTATGRDTNASAISSDFTTFLKMLTTQMQNQDPLNPLDSTDFAMQLATFAGVEQQVKTNDLLSDLSSQLGLMSLAQLSGWIGKEARTTKDVHFDGRPITVFPSPAKGADRAVLVVRDHTGAVVARETLPLSGAGYEWRGTDAAGKPLPEGRYRLSVESSQGDKVISTTPVASFAPIQEARRDGNSIILVLKGGIEAAEKDVLALRDA